MTARLPDPQIAPPDRIPPTGTPPADNEVTTAMETAAPAIAVGHPHRSDAGIRRLFWRRRRNVRTTVFRHRLRSLGVRP